MPKIIKAPVEVGEIVAEKYRVERILGAGAMGVVVAARHVDLHELRAIKFMLPEALEDHTAVERFLREARAVVRLKSQHVVKVHDVGKLSTGAPYIVMEHLEGRDLRALLKERGGIPVEEAALYVTQAGEAIEEAHAAGVIHRDLKPGNLFLTRGLKGAPCVKVLDFGIAKLAKEVVGEDAAELTKTSSVVGTPAYMAPEQMRARKAVDARADIWALGVILYRLVTGHTPFQGTDITEIYTSVLLEEPTPIAAHVPGVPPAFEAVVRRCLEKDPAARFPNVGELVAALAPFLAGNAGRSGAETAGDARAPAAVGLSAPMNALVRSSSSLTSVSAESAPPARSSSGAAVAAEASATGPGMGIAFLPSNAPPPKRAPWATIAGGAAVIAGVAAAFIAIGSGKRDPAPIAAPGASAIAIAIASVSTSTSTSAIASVSTAPPPIVASAPPPVIEPAGSAAPPAASATTAARASADAGAPGVGAPRTAPPRARPGKAARGDDDAFGKSRH